MRKKLYLLLQKQLPAFSLIELSLVLVIIGVLMGAVFKGQEILDTSKIQSVIMDYQNIKMAMQSYYDTYNALPGDDSNASQRFGGDVNNGNGNGIIDDGESDLVWLHLFKAGDLATPVPLSSKLGGNYSIHFKNDDGEQGHWLKLAAQNESGALTPKQAQKLMSRVDGQGVGDNTRIGSVRVENGNGNSGCVNGSVLNMQNTSRVCVVYLRLF